MMNKILVFIFFFNLSIGNAQIINFPDTNFKAKLLQADTNNNLAGGFKIDANNDGEITQSEAMAIYELNFPPGNILDITGIQFFTNIMYIGMATNNIHIADLSNLKFLETLDFGANQISSINLTGLNNLWYINLGGNQLTTVDFSTLAALKILIIGQNLLTHLDFSNNPLFEQLNCADNPNLNWINIRNNKLQRFLGTGFTVCWSGIPNLTTICVDDNEVVPAQTYFASYGINQRLR